MSQQPIRRPLILTSDHGPAPRDGEPDRPRRDFEMLAQRLGGRVVYPGSGCGVVAMVERRLRLDIGQAVRARRASASAYMSLSERVGMPLSLLRPDTPHVLIAHLLTSREKRLVSRLTGFLRRADVTLVFSRPQERYLHEEVGLDQRQARFIWDKVDHRFFSPCSNGSGGDYVLSVGREQRDYAALVDALRPLRLPCIIVAGSRWSHRTLPPISVPDHVELRAGLSYRELRELYRGARVVVVPIYPDVDYAAGANGVLEGMSCAAPVVTSDTPGLAGYVSDGENGRLVRPGDPAMLRTVVEELWEDRSQAARIAGAGRETVERERTMEHFVARVCEIVAELG